MKYKGDDHEFCDDCGYCIDCGDCKKYGCDSPNIGNKSTAQNNTAFTDMSKLNVKSTAQQ